MNPIGGKIIYNALKDKNCIILACNPRITIGVARGIFRAAKDLRAAIIMELARTECNLEGGYSGLTPQMLSDNLLKANKEIGHNIWALHADHIQIKTGSSEELAQTKELILAQIKAGYTSFCIDASHLFDFKADNLEGELAPNLKATIEIGNFIKANAQMGFGLEVEVGEIGRKNTKGMILTTGKEAVYFIGKLLEAKLDPDILAIANGSTHGNVYDDDGNIKPQTSIDIELTVDITRALRAKKYNTRIAQHGITGTPLEIIRDKFPHGDILKGNVATLFQTIVFETLKKHHPKLYNQMFNWVITNKPIEGKKTQEVFGKNGKFAIKQFFNEIYAMSSQCEKEIEDNTYKATCNYIKAFKSEGSAEIVKKSMVI